MRELIQTVTSGTFDAAVLHGEGPIAIEFMSYGCGHCRKLEPVLKKVAGILESKEKIFRVNTADEQELTERYQIEGTPTLILFLNGREVGRLEGPPPGETALLSAMTKPFDLTNAAK